MTDYKQMIAAFESLHTVPECAVWSEELNGYVWATSSGICPIINDRWEAFRNGAEWREQQGAIAAVKECDCCGYPGHDLPAWREVLQQSAPAAAKEWMRAMCWQPATATVPEGENKYGLDVGYFHQQLGIIQKDIMLYAPDALMRALVKLALTASPGSESGAGE